VFYNKNLKYIFFVYILFYFNISISAEKIFFIDMDFIMNNSLAGKSIIKQLSVQKQKNIKTFKNIEKKLNDDETKIIEQKKIIDQNEYNKKIRIFKTHVSNYKKMRNDLNNELSNKKNDAQKNILEILTPILANYSKENSISLILPKQNIIIGKKEFDLTNVILKILDTEVKNIKLQ
tara:strand:+ start:204 stop:734 length:531 start_codon:yes stop_codon:yes gene_type:complete